MKVPCKITLIGDKDYARNFIGAAQSQLRILENQMTFHNLKQGIRRTQINPRTMVESIKCFNMLEVKIYCLPEKGKQEGFAPPDCFCCCCWAMGFIVGYTDEEHFCSDEGCNDCEIRYDVRVCQKNRYSLFQGCIPTDFAHYRIGEQVFVMVANSSTDGWNYTYKDQGEIDYLFTREDIVDLFNLKDMIPSLLFSLDEYKTSAQKNDFEKCEECEKKQECKDGIVRHCRTITENETEESDAVCMTETITLIPRDYINDEIIREPRNCEEYQFEIGSACGVSRSLNIPPFYIVPIGCEKELSKWL